MVSEGVEPGVGAGLALCDVTKGRFPEAFVFRAHFFGRSWIRLFSADGGKVSFASYGTLTVRRVTPARRPRQQNQTQALSLMTGPLGLRLSVNDGDDGADWCVGGSFGGAARKLPQTVIAAERRRRCESSRGQKKKKKKKKTD